MSSPPDVALLSFDLHLRSCGDCLAVGNALCLEGQYLADTVRASRRRPGLQDRRRPSFPSARLPEVFA